MTLNSSMAGRMLLKNMSNGAEHNALNMLNSKSKAITATYNVDILHSVKAHDHPTWGILPHSTHVQNLYTNSLVIAWG